MEHIPRTKRDGKYAVNEPEGPLLWPKAFRHGWPLLPAQTWRDSMGEVSDLPCFRLWPAGWQRIAWARSPPPRGLVGAWAGEAAGWPAHKAQLVLGAPGSVVNGMLPQRAFPGWFSVTAFDVDVDDPLVSEYCKRLLLERFEGLVRYGTLPRFALVLRAAEVICNRSMVGVEFFGWSRLLGPGHLITAYGHHRTTKQPYSWDLDTGGPHERHLVHLPMYQAADVKSALLALQRFFHRQGLNTRQKKREWRST